MELGVVESGGGRVDEEGEVVGQVHQGIHFTQTNSQQSIGQHLHKVFPIHESNTIIDPRTMVVHIEYTPVAL